MARFALWIEGVDFDATLFDTNDISTVRGAPLALLEAPDWARAFLEERGVAVETVFTGASLGALILDCGESAAKEAVAELERALARTGADPDDVRAAAEKAAKEASKTGRYTIDTLPLAHMRFATGLAEIRTGGPEREAAAIESARSVAQAARYRGAAARQPLAPALRPCRKDRTRPADCTILVPRDDPGSVAGPGTPHAMELPVSRAVAARRHFGRHMRQAFYISNLGPGRSGFFSPDPQRFGGIGDLTFTDSLQEMVAQHSEDEWKRLRQQHRIPLQGEAFGVPLALRNKIAVFCADGNGFTGIREAICSRRGTREGLRLFSEELKKLQRERLMTPLLEGFVRDALSSSRAESERIAYFNERDKVFKLRFETLLWGGDEVMFAMPSWLGWTFARRFFRTVADWEIDGQPLTFSAGLLFCNCKTPIREARSIAAQLGDMAKAAVKARGLGSGLEADVLESIEPPVEGIDGLRASLTGASALEGLAIAADELDDMTGRIRALKDRESDRRLPRSQLYKMLGAIRGAGQTPAGGGGIAAAAFEAYLKRGGTDRGAGLSAADLALTQGCRETGELGLNLYRLAQLWDYVPEESDDLRAA